METTIASHEAEMFPKKFENILVTVALFPYFPNFSNVIKIRAMVNNSLCFVGANISHKNISCF